MTGREAAEVQGWVYRTSTTTRLHKMGFAVSSGSRQAPPPMLYGEEKPRDVPGQQRQVPELTSEQLDESLDSSQTHRRHKRQESARTSLNDHLETDIDNLDAAHGKRWRS